MKSAKRSLTVGKPYTRKCGKLDIFRATDYYAWKSASTNLDRKGERTILLFVNSPTLINKIHRFPLKIGQEIDYDVLNMFYFM